jgi:signal transduction histidine kinase
MTAMPFVELRRSDDDRVVAGVCAGIAHAIGVDPTLVRLVFTLLALAGGAGVALYGACWLYMEGKGWLALIGVLAAAGLGLAALGLGTWASVALVLIACGLVVIWRGGGSLRPGEPVSLAGLALVTFGAALLLAQGSGTSFLAPGAIGGALLLIVGPWLWQLARERDAERTARIRSEERAEVAARVHDSVLQTLALIQRHADEPRRVASLARRQERELRSWLYGDGTPTGETLLGALADAAAEVEEVHGLRVELASGGDCPLDDDVRAVVLAAREAMQNAAKFAGVDEIAVYAECDSGRVSVFVRDRGAGFDRASVPSDRRGLAESIEGRMARAGGTATITTSPGEGTEVELVLPRRQA